MKTLAIVLALCFFSAANSLQAGSAMWSANPTSSDWNTPGNWTPPTVPDGPSDVATFASSSQTLIDIPNATEVDSIVFNAGADPFTLVQEFSDFGENSFTFSGAGIINNSGVVQNFVASAIGYGTYFLFYNTASAGVLTHFRLETSDTSSTVLEFHDSSSAGSATILNEGGKLAIGGETFFFDNSTAANATITANGGTLSGVEGAAITFDSSSTADHALLIANGTAASGAFGGRISFYGLANAGAATIIANGSPAAQGGDDAAAVDGRAGQILFLASSNGGTARLELLGNSVLDLSLHTPLGMQIGSSKVRGLFF